uniref:NADH dehydrogenase [ubiquinone] 1 alpha subcomplex subunit 5 n=1 Tax=Vombatus ursinus TaxID=29139 RepID=A0A4X2KSJ0_VOMUR
MLKKTLFSHTMGLVELAVCETPEEHLGLLYSKVLNALEFMPSNAAYRKYKEQITNERLNKGKEETDLQKLEHKLQAGQLEEVILQDKNELSLPRKMLTWKPWEPLVEEPPASQGK